MNKTLINQNHHYISIYGEIASHILIEKKSKFLSYIFQISSVEQADNCIEKIKKDHKDANHVVYAYSIVINQHKMVKYHEDGEPSGTATKSIYEMLEKENLTNLCVVIVRYFGGILLGTGPLTRAYLNAFKYAYELCDKVTVFEYLPYTTTLSYAKYKEIENLLNQNIQQKIIKVEQIQFLEQVQLKIEIQKDAYDQITDLFEQRRN